MLSRMSPIAATALIAGTAVLVSCAESPSAPVIATDAEALAKAPPPNLRAASFYWGVGARYGIQPDGRRPATIDGASYSEFRNGDCGIRSMINLTNYGDTFHDPDDTYSRRSACSDGNSVARFENIVFPVQTGWASERISNMYVRRLYYFDNGSTDPVYANWRNTITMSTSGACGQLWFHEATYPGSSNVLITRTTVNGLGAFRIASDSAKGHLAWCVNRGAAVAVPFSLIVVDLGPA